MTFLSTAETTSRLFVTGLRTIRFAMAFLATLKAASLAFTPTFAGIGAVGLAVTFFTALETSSGLRRIGTILFVVAFLAAVETGAFHIRLWTVCLVVAFLAALEATLLAFTAGIATSTPTGSRGG